jgi:hypothetical protein
LWTLKQGCLRAQQQPIFAAAAFRSVLDHLDLALAAMKKEECDATMIKTAENERPVWNLSKPDVQPWIAAASNLSTTITELLAKVDFARCPETAWWLTECQSKLRDLLNLAESFAPWLLPASSDGAKALPRLYDAKMLCAISLENYVKTLAKICDFQADAPQGARLANCVANVEELRLQLHQIAEDAEKFVNEMDFRLFYSEAHKALSVGYDVTQSRMQPSFYDLLASEARSAVFVAIAKNDIPQEAWFAMGRTHTRYAKRNVLLSWTGTMFEYLMPALWMKHFPSTLLENSVEGAVACQKAYVQRHEIPWGISEGACSRKNDSGHFEYFAFGVPPLALKQNPPANTVITPYASALALTANSEDALKNLREMESRGWVGRFGFYESAEYVPGNEDGEGRFVIVPSWMAHHQGMILLSICNFLSNSIFQELFHEEVRVAATERILHERPLSAQAIKTVAESEPELAADVAPAGA